MLVAPLDIVSVCHSAPVITRRHAGATGDGWRVIAAPAYNHATVRRLVLAMTVILLAAPAHAETPAKVDWFAFDVDLGGGTSLSPTREGFFLGRLRAGYARVRGKLFSSAGVAVETKDVGAPTYGVAGELVSLRNLVAAHAGVMTSDLRDVTIELGAGWAGLRAEAQLTLGDGSTAVALLGVVRLPIGAVAYKLLRD